MYKGDADSLLRWYQAYGWQRGEQTARNQHRIMARAMLYYAEGFQQLIQTIAGPQTRPDWAALAAVFWHLDPPEAVGDVAA